MSLDEEQIGIRRYLLGYSEPNAAESIEERLISDEGYLQEFSIITDELIEDYLDGALSEDEAARFESHFLTTARRSRKVEIARALAEKANLEESQVQAETETANRFVAKTNVTPSSKPASRQKYWLLAAAVAAILFFGFLARQIWWRNSPPPYQANNQTNKQFQDELARLNDPTSKLPTGSSVNLPISPVTLREVGEDRRVNIKSDTQTVLVRLILVDAQYGSYQASLQTADAVNLGAIQQLKPTVEEGGRFVIVRLPAQMLSPGSYQIKLAAETSPGVFEDVGTYSFQVLKT